jgi:hypothetical protein
VGEAEVRLAGLAGILPATRSRGGGTLGHELSEGLPVPREPAYAAKRSQDGEAPAASE